MNTLAARSLLFFLACVLGDSTSFAQTASSYDTLIQQGKLELKAGNADQALRVGQSAEKIEAERWEGYALAGGALMNLGRYEEAIDALTKAIGSAPENKRPALEDLRRACARAESGETSKAGTVPPSTTSSSSQVMQAELVLWMSIESSSNAADYQRYLAQYPEGTFARAAKSRMNSLLKSDATNDWALGWDEERASNYSAAASHYQHACDGGEPRGCRYLGTLFLNGQGVGQDDGRAAGLYKKGCDMREGTSCANLAFMYDKGRGVGMDYTRAVEYYKEGCDDGEPMGCAGLGTKYRDGKGVKQDTVQAAQLFKKSCDGGYSFGCRFAAMLYENGAGVDHDETLARQYYARACSLGDSANCGK
jgi:tetratricopeptide (TPR) repeat protein